MEIQAEDTVGLIIQNENGLVYQGYPNSTLTYNGTGTRWPNRLCVCWL